MDYSGSSADRSETTDSRSRESQPREGATMAKDAVEAAPNVYTVLFENERVRLLQARVRPGDSSAMHSHPNYLVYSLGDSKVTFTEASGQSVDVELKDGQPMWREAEEHAAKNNGSTDVVALLFELK